MSLVLTPVLSCPCQVSSDAVNRTFTALVICEKGNEEEDGKGNNNKAFPHLYNTALFIPEGRFVDMKHIYAAAFSFHGAVCVNAEEV